MDESALKMNKLLSRFLVKAKFEAERKKLTNFEAMRSDFSEPFSDEFIFLFGKQTFLIYMLKWKEE